MNLNIQLISKPEMSIAESTNIIMEALPGIHSLVSSDAQTGIVCLKLVNHHKRLTIKQRDWLHLTPFAARYIDSYKVVPENEWFFWTHNQRCHFIRFRHIDDTVATATVFVREERFAWKVNGPCWSTYEEEGTADTLEEAKQAVEQRVQKIIREEFKPEYVAPLG